MKIINKKLEVSASGIITDLSLPKKLNILKDVFAPDLNSPCTITIVLTEPYTEELAIAMNKLFTSDKLQITLSYESEI